MKKTMATLLICTLLATTLCGCGDLLELGKSAEDLLQQAQDMLPQEATLPTFSSAEVGLNLYTASVQPGGSVQLELTGSDSAAQWRSSNEGIALVNSQGTVTGVSAGVANIICTVDGRELSCTVTVTADAQPAASASDFIFPHSSSAYLTESEIAATLAACSGYSPGKGYAQDAINEIYARNGYIFKTAEVRDYYQAKSWYIPNSSFSDADFNEYEKHNLALLRKY